MEIFVAHDRFDGRKVGVGRGGLGRQHIFGVEDVQALVLHRTHVEVAGGHDHETLQVQRQAETGFVPGDGGHQGVHRVFGFAEVAAAHVDFEQVFLAGSREDALLA